MSREPLPGMPLTIQFAHPVYRLAERFAPRDAGLPHFQTWDAAATRERIGEADVLVISGLWHDALLAGAPRLRLIQTCSAGYDHFGLAALRERGVRMANARGVNVDAVSEHALALMLAFTRKLHKARDHQARAMWRGSVSEFAGREDVLGGKTLLIIGFGAIGQRLGRLARAFGMQVIGVRREAAEGREHADEVQAPEQLLSLLPRAHFVVLTCPLTEATRGIIGERELAAMRPDAHLINVAGGACVDQAALLSALLSGRIAGAGLDVFAPEPLPADSPLWSLPNVIVTPHTAGDLKAYEDRVIDILLENLGRLSRGEPLRNQVL